MKNKEQLKKQSKATASFKQYKKMYIFKQLQELLLLVVINLENYINSKIG